MSFSNPYFIRNPNVTYTETEILSSYSYQSTVVNSSTKEIHTKQHDLEFKTARKVPRTGLMLVGWGGNNGSTVTAGILANKHKITWRTKEGTKHPNYFGSLTQSSTVQIGLDSVTAEPVYIPFNQLLPMVHPNDLVLGGWDISATNLAAAMERAEVLEYDLQRQLIPYMSTLSPLPSIYYKNFIAQNQVSRADNILPGKSKLAHLNKIRQDIRDFKAANNLEKVLVLWTATTERYSELVEGVHDSSENLLKAIAADHEEISPSTIFAVASILEGSSFINGSPQNTFTPAVIELAEDKRVFIVGDDFKSGQTKMKSVLVDFLVSAGIKPVSIVSYNHLGNNDGKNLSAPEQFRSKEISKSNVVDDMVHSNRLLYKEGEHPDHVVVIKYVPYVKDSKRALDEYTSEIFLNGRNTIVLHNTCEDSLLATPLIYDLAILCELAERIEVRTSNQGQYEKFHAVLSLLSYLMKAPLVPRGTPVVNALSAQRQCLVNTFRACVGLPPENYMTFEHKIPSLMYGSTVVMAAEEEIPSHERSEGIELVKSDITYLSTAKEKRTREESALAQLEAN